MGLIIIVWETSREFPRSKASSPIIPYICRVLQLPGIGEIVTQTSQAQPAVEMIQLNSMPLNTVSSTPAQRMGRSAPSDPLRHLRVLG